MNTEPATIPCPRGHRPIVYSTTKRCVECVVDDVANAPWPIETRAEASSRGASKYFTGKPCVHGHVKQRYVVSGICSGCNSMRSTAYQKKLRQDMRASQEGMVIHKIRTHADDAAAVDKFVEALRQARSLKL